MWPLAAMLLLTGCRVGFDTWTGNSGEDADGTRCAPSTIELPISNDLDDGEVTELFADPWVPSGEAVDAGRSFIGWWDRLPIWGYFRFSMPGRLPVGAVLRNATLTLTAGTVGGSGGAPWNPDANALEVLLEATPTPPPASSTHFPGGPDPAVLAVSGVRWPPTGGNPWPDVGRATTSPNLAAMMETVIYDPSLQALQLWVRSVDVPIDVNTEVSFSDVSVAAAPDLPAVLSLSYDCGQ